MYNVMNIHDRRTMDNHETLEQLACALHGYAVCICTLKVFKSIRIVARETAHSIFSKLTYHLENVIVYTSVTMNIALQKFHKRFSLDRFIK